MPSSKVLIVDSDRTVVASLRAHLVKAGFETMAAYTVQDGMRKFVEVLPDAVVLRDEVPGPRGVEMAWRLREMSDVPVIFISDRKDRFLLERALQVGDDYMLPPWSWEKLAAKLLSLLKRRRNKTSHLLSCDDGNLKIDLAGRQVTKGGRPVHLTSMEFKLLSYFVRQANRVLQYDELLAHVWGHTDPKAKSQVSLYVRYLRKKIEDNPARPTYLCTERGVGYSFRMPVVALQSFSPSH
jgi:two-component system KDP operon response regulator KdpE